MSVAFEGTEASYIAGTPYVGANVRMNAGPGQQSGRRREAFAGSAQRVAEGLVELHDERING